MSRINISFDRGLALEGTLVPVEVLDHRLASVAEPIVGSWLDKAVDVPGPGLYLVRAELPSGEMLEATVKVPDSESEVPLKLGPSQQSTATLASEDLEWSLERFAHPERFVRFTNYENLSWERSPRRGLIERSELFRLKAGSKTWVFVPVSDMSLTISNHQEPGHGTGLMPDQELPRDMGTGNDWYPVYFRCRFRERPHSAPRDAIYAIPPARLARISLVGSNPDAGSDSDAEGEPVANVLVSAAAPQAEALLSFADRGSLKAARRIASNVIADAVFYLREKRDDPTSAVLAGYFLLRAGHLEKSEWMKNLADWFPAFPDGAIIYGASLLRDQQNEERRADARNYLLKAVQRGIPAYTIGLRFLFDSLRQLQQERSDGAVDEAVSRVRRVAAFADWDATTTSFVVPTDHRRLPFSFDMTPSRGRWGSGPLRGVWDALRFPVNRPTSTRK